MKTNFFQIVAHLKSSSSWTIHISPMVDDKLLVSVLFTDPEGDKQSIQLVPMIFNETPKNLDEIIFSKLAEPVMQTNDLWQNVSEFQKSMELAKKQLDEKSKTKSNTTAGNPADKKLKFEEAMKKVAELNGLCKYDEALALLPAESEYPDKKAELEKVRNELEAKNKQLSLL